MLFNVRRNFNIRHTFKKAVDLVRLSYQLYHKQLMSTVNKAHAASNEVTEEEKGIKIANEGIEQVLNI